MHGWPCKFYADDVVKVGTKATRFTLKVPADEVSWFATTQVTCRADQTRAGRGGRAPDRSGRRGCHGRAKAAAAAKQAAQLAASKQITAGRAASPRRKAAAKVEGAVHHEMIAGQKRKLAEAELKYAKVTAKVAQAAPFVAGLAKVASAPLQTKLESFLQRCPM